MEKKEEEMDAELSSLDEDAAQKHKEYMEAYGKWHDFHEQVVRDKAIIAERKAVSATTHPILLDYQC